MKLVAFFSFIFSLFISGAWAEDICEYLLDPTSRIQWPDGWDRRGPSIVDAVWSSDSKRVLALSTWGNVLEFDALSGLHLSTREIPAPANPDSMTRVLLGPDFIVTFGQGLEDPDRLQIGNLRANYKTIEMNSAPIRWLDIPNFGVHNIQLNAEGTQLVAFGAVFGKQEKILLYDFDAAQRTTHLKKVLDMNADSLFAREFQLAGVNPYYQIPWFGRVTSLSNDFSRVLIGGVSNQREKAVPIDDVMRAFWMNLNDLSTSVEPAIELKMRSPQEHHYFYTSHELSPSGDFLLVNYKNYDSRFYRINFTNDVDLVDLKKAGERKKIALPEDELYLGMVQHSPDWIVTMRIAWNAEGATRDSLGFEGTHLVIRDLRNEVNVIGEIEFGPSDGILHPTELLGSYKGHFTSAPKGAPESLKFMLTNSGMQTLKFQVSPDHRSLLMLRQDRRMGCSEVSPQNNLSLRTFAIKPLNYRGD